MCRQRLVQLKWRAQASFVAALLVVTAVAQADSPAEELLKARFNVDLGTFVVASNLNGSLRGTANTTDQKSISTSNSAPMPTRRVSASM